MTVTAVTARTFAVTRPTEEAMTARTVYATKWKDPGAGDNMSINIPTPAATAALAIRR
jgi:hypothetical protein